MTSILRLGDKAKVVNNVPRYT